MFISYSTISNDLHLLYKYSEYVYYKTSELKDLSLVYILIDSLKIAKRHWQLPVRLKIRNKWLMNYRRWRTEWIPSQIILPFTVPPNRAQNPRTTVEQCSQTLKLLSAKQFVIVQSYETHSVTMICDKVLVLQPLKHLFNAPHTEEEVFRRIDSET